MSFVERAVMPMRELGAYEALWMRKGTSFKSLADYFRIHPDALPSNFVCATDIERYAALALGTIRHARIGHFGLRIHGAGEYPPRLRDAKHPLALLYFMGNWDLVSSRCVAIIGTRTPSEEGRRTAAKLTQLLVADRFTIVSGLARGIDTVAHTTALTEGGFTIAILGTPITECYPSENRGLQHRISSRHLVVSQVPIVHYAQQPLRVKRGFFPERNSTISAMSEATIVVEAADSSGTLTAARHALDQGRPLFILDSCLKNRSLSWPRVLLNRGAIRVREYQDIQQHLSRAS